MFEQNVTLGPGTGTFTQHTFEILLMLFGAFLLGIWLGWALWAKYKQQIDKMSLELQSLNVTADALRNELVQVKNQHAALETDFNHLSSENASLNRNNANLRERIAEMEASLATAAEENRVLDTELQLQQQPEVVQPVDVPLEVSAAASTTLIEPAPAPEALPDPLPTPEALPDPIPTPELLESPVKIALAENSPAPLIIEPVSIVEPQPEKKKSGSKKSEQDKAALIGGAVPSEDLTVVEGIGPKIQMLLNQYGIYTYRQLADTEVDRLKEILSTAGPQLAMHDPGTWPSQANLAANDQWDTLKSVQGFLKGGKKPN